MAKPPSSIQPKPVRWVGSSREDLRGFPEEVRNRLTFHPAITVQEVLDRALEPARDVAHVA